MTYQLMYFPGRGRAEQIRLLLTELGQDFENLFVDGDAMRRLKSEGPRTLYFGQVPMLRDGDFVLCQGAAIMGYLARKHGIAPADVRAGARADAIVLGAEDLRVRCFDITSSSEAAAKQADFLAKSWVKRWRPSFDGLLEQNGDTGFFAGAALSHADVAVWDVLDAVLTEVAGASLAGHPRLEQFYRAFAARPRISPYLAQR